MEISVVITDDAPFMRQMIKNILNNTQYKVIGEANNGKIAVQKYKELKPDLITLDITMPEKNGIKAAKEILSFDKNANIIMCSAMGQQKMVLKAVKAGAKDFVVKPFKPDRVLSSFNSIFNNQKEGENCE